MEITMELAQVSWPQGKKTFFLKPNEHKIYPAHKF